MASPGRGARIKGHNFEREIAKMLSEATGSEFERGLGQARHGGSENSDVRSDEFPEFHFECKRHKKCNIKEAVRQAKKDIEDSKESRIPIIVTKDDREEILVTMTMTDWLKFFQAYIDEPLLVKGLLECSGTKAET